MRSHNARVRIFVRDALGRDVALERPPRRVVSLVPSITETLFDLGAGDDVVACTDFCIFPEGIERPRVGGTKNPDIETIRALRPDLVHMNLEENLKRHGDAIAAFAPLFVSEPKSVGDVATLIRALGEIHDRVSAAEDFAARIDAAVAALPPRSFTFACAIWKDPWMWCGGDTYVSSLIGTAGGKNVLESERRYPSRTLEQIAALRPDIIFLPDEPFLFTGEHAGEVRNVTNARVIGPFPGHLFTWHGTRTLNGLEFLAVSV